MKVDILRQLDEWGTQLEDSIEHVSAAEVMERLPQLFASQVTSDPATDESAGAAVQPRSLWQPMHRRVLRYAGAFLALIVVLGGIVQLAGQETFEEFSSVGGSFGDNSGRDNPVSFPATTAAATTAAPATFAPDTTAAATTTRPPAASTTVPPNTTVVGTTTIPPAGGNPSDLGRAVIFVADMSIDTTDVSGAVTQARAIVESRGGFVFGQELGGQNTVMSLKVPAEFFQDTLDRLSALGVVRNARVTSEDVTERIVDIESQITTAEASVERLQELLRGADSIDTVARLESELLSRETTLERLRGRLRTLQDQVALSTIVVTIREFVPSPDLRVAIAVHGVARGGSEECFTDPGPQPDKDGTYVLCVSITNTGNLDLTNIEVTGPPDLALGLRPTSGRDLGVLPVGETVTLWTTAVADQSLFERFNVRASAIDDDGQLLNESIVDKERALDLPVREPQPEPQSEPEDGLPSLRDALDAGWTVLKTGANVLGVAVAFLLPLLWIPAVAFGIYWWRRRRSAP